MAPPSRRFLCPVPPRSTRSKSAQTCTSRSGFYAWQQRPPSVREMANRRLSKEIRTIHHEVNGIYGHRRIKAELTAMGQACGRHRVARLMREAGLRVRSRKRWRLVSSSRHDLPIAPNHLDRQFVSDRANRHWVSDMTYVRTAQGWLYLAVVLDLYSRAVVGWAMHHRMQQALVHAALEMAVARRQPQAEVLLHSDRGSQYCAYDYQALLRRHRIVPSHSRPGNCWDNAAMESFFRSLKAERVYLTRYASYQEAKTDLFDYIRFYNHRRRHSTLGYLSPMEFERRYASSNS
ncbi:IS3 family transposase [Pseudomonas aeruginosa]